MPQLHVQCGDAPVRVVELTDRVVSVGRADDNDVVIPEPKASRRHCTFRPVGPGWRVVDERSSNGTWLGDRPVLSARLQPGDEVEIGGTVISFVGQAFEAPRPPSSRRRPRRRVGLPWEALVGAAVLAVVAWFGAGALAQEQAARETAAWKRVAESGIARADLEPDDAARGALLDALATDLDARPHAADAATIVRGALARKPRDGDGATARPAWADSLARIEDARARMSPTERRVKLRELLSRFAGDPGAVEAVAGALKADEAAARERDASAAAQYLADAEAAVAEGRLGDAFSDWQAWFSTAPEVAPGEEKAVAAKMADAARRAALDAGEVAAQYEAHLKEGRIAAADAAATSALERLRGTGWDAWLAARVRRLGAPGAGVPTAGGTGEPEADRARRLARERLDRAMRASDALARRRRFTDAAVTLGEAAEHEMDESLRADLRARVDDLSAEAAVLGLVLRRAEDDPARFGAIPLDGGAAKLAGASEDAILVAAGKGAEPRRVPVEDLPTSALAALLDGAALEPPSFVGAALLMREVGEEPAYVRWMRAALADESLQPDASAVHARLLGAAVPAGGYHPHPTDDGSILTSDELKALRNAGLIAERTAELAKVLEKVEASKQAKQVESVAEAYAKLEAARKHALELIFDEVKYFYPYRHRMKEYAPVQREVDERVKAVRDAWEDRTTAKVRPDAALTKLLDQAESLASEIEFHGGDPAPLLERADRLRSYLGKDLTVRTFFVTELDGKLLEANEAMLAENAKARGCTDEEREQVRITNEYRIMMGHRRALRLHEKLVLAARGHSEDMSTIGFFDHESPVPGKKTPWDRMNLAGYPNTPCSENISAGRGDPQGAHDGWCHSSGHHRNILSPQWSEMGSGQAGRYWTQNYGYAAGDDAVGGTGPR